MLNLHVFLLVFHGFCLPPPPRGNWETPLYNGAMLTALPLLPLWDVAMAGHGLRSLLNLCREAAREKWSFWYWLDGDENWVNIVNFIWFLMYDLTIIIIYNITYDIITNGLICVYIHIYIYIWLINLIIRVNGEMTPFNQNLIKFLMWGQKSNQKMLILSWWWTIVDNQSSFPWFFKDAMFVVHPNYTPRMGIESGHFTHNQWKISACLTNRHSSIMRTQWASQTRMAYHCVSNVSPII